ncbi:hypothetical protein BN1095_7290001 [Clostridioides difficile]|uniref:Uncharacterized protein n=1 Tax=Clostridioides difficile TaxID=1496 RepID=A0A069AUY1_CLODI|nr:hypothetical protein BN1095_7290001 [Clostridioides difficile]
MRIFADIAVGNGVEYQQDGGVAGIEQGVTPVAEQAGADDEGQNQDAEAGIDAAEQVGQHADHRDVRHRAETRHFQRLPLPMRMDDGKENQPAGNGEPNIKMPTPSTKRAGFHVR